MNGSNLRWLIIVILLTVFSIWVILPDTQGIHIDSDNDGKPTSMSMSNSNWVSTSLGGCVFC